jgi:RNA polymerase sigma-70 factor, ECF subfamily
MSEFTRKTESDPDEASGGPVLLEHLFRRQAGRLVSCLVRLLGPQHLQLAEDAVQEAMLRAAQRWPFEGVPEKPEGWLYRVAHNFAISALRWNSRFEKQTDGLVEKLEARRELADDLYLDGQLRDAELCMLFMCCHPELSREAQLALSLKLVGGFGAGEIARIFLVEESTIAQRLVRAKRLIRERRLPLTLPGKSELRERLESVLEAIYLMFSAGYAAGAGEELIRQDVCLEALRLGRLVAASNMALASADALVALMALQAARLPARTDAAGDLVLLEEQDRGLWDGGLIGIGFTYFELSMRGDEVSVWHVQAAIAATYATAGTPDEIDWAAILGHYDQLLRMQPSPVVALNRAIAVMRVHGAAAGLNELRPLQGHAAMKGYHLLPAVRGQMLVEVGRLAEAEAEFEAALDCRCSEPERRFLRKRLETIGIEVGR